MPVDRTTSRRTDEQLNAILDESADWSIVGHEGRELCSSASLRLLIEKVRHYGHAGIPVTAVCRLPFDNIVVFEQQLTRLRSTVDVREMTIQ